LFRKSREDISNQLGIISPTMKA